MIGRHDANDPSADARQGSADLIELPTPDVRGSVTLAATLAARRSQRAYTAEPLSPEAISQLLWAAQGITESERRRTAPSAGALHPLEVYLLTGEGVFHYRPYGHRLAAVIPEDRRSAVAGAGLDQEALHGAPAVFAITAVYARTEAKYGDRAERYVQLDAGHAAQNLLLQATALGLGAVPIGAFEDAELAAVLDLPPGEKPLYLIPVGHPAG